MRELMNYSPKEPSKLTKLLWRAAGADERVLMQCSYSDHVKYAGIGAIIFFTAFLASISAGFAIYTIFSDKSVGANNTTPLILSIVFSILWGIMIYNLDRFIVSATGKGDGKEGISWYDLSLGWPRMLLAIIIGVVISAPLEVKIMQPEIEEELAHHYAQQDSIFHSQFNTDFDRNDEVKLLKINLTKLNENIAEKEKQKNDFEEQMVTEARIVKPGERYKAVKLSRDGVVNEIELLTKEKKSIEEKLDGLRKKIIGTNEEEAKNRVRNGSGLMSRILMAEEYAEKHKSWIPWLIRFFFIILEITPVLTKMMLIKSPYDYLDENLQEITKAKEAIEIRREFMKSENGKDIAKSENYVPQQIIKEQKDIVKAQEELSDLIIQKWKDKETKGIESDVENYIKRKDSSA